VVLPLKNWVEQAYKDYSVGKQTLAELEQKYGKSERTIRRHFDKFSPSIDKPHPCPEPVSLVFDGTFFGRGCGLMIYRAKAKNIYWREIDNEKISYIDEDLRHLQKIGWQFCSFTIDGRRGVIKLLEKLFPNKPIQLCIFHQKKTIQRYLTMNPKSDCAKEIKELMADLTTISEANFEKKLAEIKSKYRDFLLERNDKNQFMHRKIRSAIRSLISNKNYLFTFQKYPKLAIPNTTNSCDGSFAHWKSKVKIHRGLKKNRRAKMIEFLLKNS